MGGITNGALGVSLDPPRIPAERERLRDLPVSGQKRVLLAAPRGYCAGVDRAVIAVEKALEHYGAPVYVRKQIVHNVHVVSELEQRGAIFVDEVDEVPPGSHLVFSAHGVSPMVVQAAADRDLQAIDATCPLVTKVHREAIRFAKADAQILLIGHAGHEEVEGTMGHAPERTILVGSPDAVDELDIGNPENLVWISQTTLSVDETMETVRRLRERYPQLQDPPSDDICYATQNRQVAIKKVAKDADLVIVVGSANSSNSVRLVEVALEHGAKAAYRVDYASEIKQEWLDGVVTVGVTSGASVPEVLVNEVLADLADAGYGSVEEIRTAEEDLMFSLPKELRRDASGATDSRALGGPWSVMTDDHRPAPQYGEYATPEEVARLRGAQSPPEPVIRQADPVKQAAAPTRPRRAWDLPFTGGLLVLGFVLTLQALPGFFDFSATLTAAFKVSGVDVDFGADADAAGIALLIVHCALLLAAIGISVVQLRAGRPAFWVPLAAGVLAVIADIVIPLVLILTNPAYASVLLDRQ